MVAIIFAHPWHGSFNKAILDAIITQLNENNRSYEIIDLYKDGFNPVLSESELSIYNKGEYSDPLVGKYQSILKEADEVIFLFPIWWGRMPAILSGLFDKVMLVNFSHNYQNGWTPLLTNIQKTVVISTSQSPTELFTLSMEKVFIQGSLQAIGFQNPTWINCENTSLGNDMHRKNFIEKVKKTV